jgi:hypothetical protein
MNQKQLLRKIQSAQATRRIWIDEQAEPFPTCNCWCQASMELDYEQGYDLMTQRLSQWLNEHAQCEPKVEEQAS